jgi:hypothetical protein
LIIKSEIYLSVVNIFAASTFCKAASIPAFHFNLSSASVSPLCLLRSTKVPAVILMILSKSFENSSNKIKSEANKVFPDILASALA